MSSGSSIPSKAVTSTFLYIFESMIRVEHLEEIFEEDLGLVISLGSFFEVSDELFPAFINFLEDLGENINGNILMHFLMKYTVILSI